MIRHSTSLINRAIILLALCITLIAAPPLVSAQDGAVATEPAASEQTRPLASATITVEDITLELFFENVKQGRAALVRVSGEHLAGARVRFLDRTSDCFYVEADGGYYGLLAVNMDQTPRTYEFSVFAWREDGTRVTLPAQVNVTLGGFVRQDFAIVADRAYLIDPEIERAEFARLDSVVAPFAPEKLWGGDGFQYPIQSTLTSPFGAYRVLNESVETRHTGWDMRAPIGTPVQAMASGRVAFAGVMDIRGNVVVIDHGYGVYSVYAHFSQVHVTRGQTVTRGQIIGVSGDSGRSGGPHFHWEVVVNGQWVDSVDFVEMWLP